MKKLIIGCLSLALIFVLGFTTACNSTKTENVEDGIIVENLASNGMIFKMTKLSTGSSEPSAQAEDSLQVTATVSPSSAIDKTVTWQFLDSSGNEVSNLSSYLTYTVSSDTLIITITRVANWSSTITLKCVSNAKSTVYATCNLDCYKRVSTLQFGDHICDDGEDFDYTVNNTTKEIDLTELGIVYLSQQVFFSKTKLDTYLNLATVGTKDVTSSVKYEIALTSNIKTMLDNLAVGPSYNSNYVDIAGNGDCIYDIITDLMDTGGVLTADEIKSVLGQTSGWCTLKITYTSDVETKEVVYTMLFDISEDLVPDSITLNQSQLIF